MQELQSIELKTQRFLDEHGLMSEQDFRAMMNFSEQSFMARKARGSLPPAYGQGRFIVYRQAEIAEWLTNGQSYSEMEAANKSDRYAAANASALLK